MKKIYSVEEYIETNDKWSKGLDILRNIILKTELTEVIKWRIPVYTINNKNVLGIGAFKHHFGIWFFNGVFLKDEHHVLVNAQDGKTKAMRQMRFESIAQIDKPIILKYIKEAIANQKAGKEIKPQRKSKKVIIPELLNAVLKSNTELLNSFNSLTNYRQREYCEYVDTAKRENTKQARLEKIIPMILSGIGLNDKYKN